MKKILLETCVSFIVSLLCLNAYGQTKKEVSFEKFKVDNLYTGTKAAINLKTNPTVRRFRTRLKETYKSSGLNFAGHYCFVYWGCGSPCQASAIIDLKTGAVYDGPGATRGYEFRKNSRMIIVNPEDSFSKENPDCIWCKSEVWVMDEKTKKFKQIQ